MAVLPKQWSINHSLTMLSAFRVGRGKKLRFSAFGQGSIKVNEAFD